MAASNIQYEIADRTRAISERGINAAHLLARNPRLEHLELLRNDEGYLDVLGATRIPDPTTAGNFCRRFDEGRIDTLQELFNDTRVKVWNEQPADFLTSRRSTADGMKFVFGIQAMQSQHVHAENLPPNAWKKLSRPAQYDVKTSPRQRPTNVKQQVLEERKFTDIRLAKEHVAEFRYRPGRCDRNYRIVVIWKDLEVHKGQRKLFDDSRCFFYVTNDFRKSTEAIVSEANHRCNQENLFAQLKGDAQSLSAPVDTLLSKWAYMVIASLAWSRKAWMALALPEGGRDAEKSRAEKYKPLRLEFTTFRRVFMAVPAQIISTGRRIVFRLLSWNLWQPVFFRLLDQLRTPLRC